MSKLTKIISQVLEIKSGKINDATSPMNVKGWDSFAGVLLITEIEKAFRTKFTMDEILSVKDVGGIKRVLKERGLDPDE
ncbi:MAG: hypothetical protein A2Z72_08435 [Omnitrophica bacterium RBG_13_46_9]|nr:MAG: hypothetical protein A2Z72_08435 [Omnitrophica bacterium RBG_13_46_9]